MRPLAAGSVAENLPVRVRTRYVGPRKGFPMAKSRGRKIAKPKRKNPWTVATARASFSGSTSEPVEVETEDAPASDVISIVSRAPSKDEIRSRAYEIYRARAGAPGSPVADWLDAERQLAATG